MRPSQRQTRCESCRGLAWWQATAGREDNEENERKVVSGAWQANAWVLQRARQARKITKLALTASIQRLACKRRSRQHREQAFCNVATQTLQPIKKGTR